MARPIFWTEEKKAEAFEKIIELIFEGKSCRSILNSDRENLPSHRVFITWLANDPILSKQYAYACEARADLLFEDILEIADDSSQDVIKTDLGDGVEIEKLNSEFVQRSRLRVDARKWIVSKLNPKKYGDKQETTHLFETPIFNGINLNVQKDNSSGENS